VWLCRRRVYGDRRCGCRDSGGARRRFTAYSHDDCGDDGFRADRAVSGAGAHSIA